MEREIVTENDTDAQAEDGRVILIVEDNIVNRLVLTGLLDKMKCEIVYAENGAVAVERFKATHVDLILMDINMPIMDGLEATKKIRALERAASNQRTPILAVTAHDDEETKQDCDAAGMDAFIPKPVRSEFLMGALSKWMH